MRHIKKVEPIVKVILMIALFMSFVNLTLVLEGLDNKINTPEKETSDVIVLEKGKGLENSKPLPEAMSFTVTAYTGENLTRTGLKPFYYEELAHGVCAVDPRVFPIGSILHVEGYGKCISADTGGAIKGHIIDVYFNTHKRAKEWGRRKNVKIRYLSNPSVHDNPNLGRLVYNK